MALIAAMVDKNLALRSESALRVYAYIYVCVWGGEYRSCVHEVKMLTQFLNVNVSGNTPVHM